MIGVVPGPAIYIAAVSKVSNIMTSDFVLETFGVGVHVPENTDVVVEVSVSCWHVTTNESVAIFEL